MGRHSLIELAWLLCALGATLALTYGAAWAYPLGREVIWVVGVISLLVVLAVNVRPLRAAFARDRSARRPRG